MHTPDAHSPSHVLTFGFLLTYFVDTIAFKTNFWVLLRVRHGPCFYMRLERSRRDDRIVTILVDTPDAHSPSHVHVLTLGLLLNFLVFVACIYGLGLTLRPPALHVHHGAGPCAVLTLPLTP